MSHFYSQDFGGRAVFTNCNTRGGMKSGERSDKKAPNSNIDLNFSASSPVESTVLIINVFLSKTIIIVLGITV